MLSLLFDVVVPVFLVALVGYAWAQSRRPFESAFVSELTLRIGTPFLIIDTMANAKIELAALSSVALATVACLVLALALGWILLRLAGLRVDTYLMTLVFANNGNVGLPLCMFAFGEAGMAYSVAYFAIGAIFNFTLGEMFYGQKMALTDMLKLPMLWAAVFGIVLSVTGTALPLALGRAFHILGGLAVPLMLLSLGVSLARLRIGSIGLSAALAATRLLGGFGIGWLVAWALNLDGVMRGVIVLQSAMPVAVYNYMLAQRYERRSEEIAGIVVLSTLMAVVLLPVFLLTVVNR